MTKIDYRIKSLLGLVGAYFLINDVLLKDNESNDYSNISILVITLVLLLIVNYFIDKSKPKKIKKDISHSIDGIINSSFDISEKINLLCDLFNRVSYYGQDLHLLDEKHRTLFYISNLEREINNGRLYQFYWNSSGNFSIETCKALKTIGAIKFHEIILKSNSKFPNNFILSNRVERHKIISEIENEAVKTWEDCENQYLVLKENYITLLYNYFTND